MRRRSLIRSALVLPACSALPVMSAHAASSDDILLGQLGPQGTALDAACHEQLAGMKLAIDMANARGGFGGRKLRWVRIDGSGLAPAMLAAKAQRLGSEPNFAAWLGPVGVGSQQALAQLPSDGRAASIGAMAVQDRQRAALPGWQFHVRASQAREAEVLVRHLGTLRLTRTAIVSRSGPDGNESAGVLGAALAERGLKPISQASVTDDPATLQEAARKLVALDPQALLLALPAHQMVGLIAQVRALRRQPAIYALSMGGGEALVEGMLQRAEGVVITQVVPHPWSDAQPALVDYRRACEPAQVRVGYASLEGYLTAQVLIEALRRVGPRVQRRTLRDQLATLQLPLAGMDIDFQQGDATGSRFVELVQIGPGGRYLR
jgi:ABC-type branched-subunit amino acid transport system substrate-binding protein